MVENNIWILFSLFFDPTLWLLVSALILIIHYLHSKLKKRKFEKFVILFFISLVLSAATSESLKLIFSIPRPCVPCTNNQINCNPYCPTTNSFPSGHTTIAFTTFTSIYLIYKKRKFLAFFIIPFLTGVSRLVLGVHTVLDVLVGSLIGIIIPIIVWEIEKNFKK